MCAALLASSASCTVNEALVHSSRIACSVLSWCEVIGGRSIILRNARTRFCEDKNGGELDTFLIATC